MESRNCCVCMFLKGICNLDKYKIKTKISCLKIPDERDKFIYGTVNRLFLHDAESNIRVHVYVFSGLWG